MHCHERMKLAQLKKIPLHESPTGTGLGGGALVTVWLP
jgi:hypothetical protein